MVTIMEVRRIMTARQGIIALALAALLVSAAFFAPVQAQAPDAGQVAVAASDGHLYLYDVASGALDPVTDDAPPSGRVYSWPTWSTGGHLAYFGVSTVDSPPYRLGIFIRPPAGEAVQVFAARDECGAGEILDTTRR